MKGRRGIQELPEYLSRFPFIKELLGWEYNVGIFKTYPFFLETKRDIAFVYLYRLVSAKLGMFSE